MRGILHNIVCGYRQPFRNASSDTVIVAVRPTYILTSSPSNTDTYADFAKFPLLSRYWLDSTGTIFTMRSGSCTLCSSLAMLVAGVGCPSSSKNILFDIFSVWMKRSPTILMLDVNAVSHDSECIDPYSTLSLTC